MIDRANDRNVALRIEDADLFDRAELPILQGGQAIILKHAGQDASQAYEPIHPPGTIEEHLDKRYHKVFESIATTRLNARAWAYYSSGADAEISLRENRAAFQRVWFRPRILRDVRTIDYSCVLLGSRSSMPIYITATALGKLGHPMGEKNLTIAAGKQDLIQMIPTLASCTFDELVQARIPGQTQWYQVHVTTDCAKTARLVLNAVQAGIKAFFITVDAPQLGRRAKDMRLKFEDFGSDVQNKNNENVGRSQGATRAISSLIDANLSWADIPWLQDAVLAQKHGLQAIVLPNHGGRQLDYSRSGLEMLVEVVTKLKSLGAVSGRDGGGHRASVLYAYSVYGAQGVVRAIQILKDELEMNMRLIGAASLDHLAPGMVDISALTNRIVDTTPHFKAQQNYIPLPQIKGSRL
ncbi:hypothetical protein PtA15_10A288 [Puccinia triticina]|uniref:FMN hydroxy acid dehydrogenase domain-containing protein n=1 Tax=Puccinia triticina TaxID=208348 RepID=A0ABY7CWN5_9BASI|nr:uncharacterized protein PtA15_10A288 [Puccinia triticina]WAQ88867.1 hypothetical protein PtA15_10A288 [Puccinia triticina]